MRQNQWRSQYFSKQIIFDSKQHGYTNSMCTAYAFFSLTRIVSHWRLLKSHKYHLIFVKISMHETLQPIHRSRNLSAASKKHRKLKNNIHPITTGSSKKISPKGLLWKYNMFQQFLLLSINKLFGIDGFVEN